MSKRDRLLLCKYYKGEDKNPWDFPRVSGYNKLRRLFWEVERKWLEDQDAATCNWGADTMSLEKIDVLQFVKGSQDKISLAAYILQNINRRCEEFGFKKLDAKSANEFYLAYVKLEPLGEKELRYLNFYLGEKKNPFPFTRDQGIYYGLFWDWEKGVFRNAQSGNHLMSHYQKEDWSSSEKGSIFADLRIPDEIKKLCLHIIGGIGCWDPYTGDKVYEAAYLKGVTNMINLNDKQIATLNDLRALEDKSIYLSIGGITGYAPTRITPEKIDELGEKEVFVFGSNKEGHHIGGAARAAMDKFGAEWGVGDGKTGRCYAISSMEGLIEMAKNVNRFIHYAKENPDYIFLVTPIGCGIAGYNPMQIAPMFMKAVVLPNVFLPKLFWEYFWQVNGICPDYYQFDKRWKDWAK